MKVLVAIEGSEFSRAAVEKSCKMFDESENTEIRIISVVEPAFVAAAPYALSTGNLFEADDGAATKAAQRIVAHAEAEVEARFPDLAIGLTTKVVKGAPDEAIIKEAREWRADLIVMGSHGYGGWRRAVLGSVSDSVMRQAPCSVLVVRPSEKPSGSYTFRGQAAETETRGGSE